MSFPKLENLLVEMRLINAALANGADHYSPAMRHACWDIGAAERSLEELGVARTPGLPTSWRPPLFVLVARLRAVRLGLEREILRRAVDSDPVAPLGPPLQAIGKALSHLIIAGAMTGELVAGERGAGLHAIADLLQAGLDQIDAMRDPAVEVGVAAIHVSSAIDRLRTQAGDQVVETRLVVEA